MDSSPRGVKRRRCRPKLQVVRSGKAVKEREDSRSTPTEAVRHVKDKVTLTVNKSIPCMVNERYSRPTCVPALPSVRRSCDIFYRHLALKGRGSPMWLPGPSSTLPSTYRRRGIAVGDVGIFTASGGFDFFFNIFLPANHPINQQGLPEGFSPLPQLQPSDIHRHVQFSPNSYLASASVGQSHKDNNPSGTTFQSSASEGAILVMPQGAYAEDLTNISRFRQYLSANAESWYRYVNDVRGREAKNGDVRLVVGCDKTSSWGMATFKDSTARDFHLKFKPTNEGGSTRTYGWEYSGMIEARVGPDPQGREELRTADDSGHLGVYHNMCLFARTLNATLRDDVWQGLGFDFETTDVQSSPQKSLSPSVFIPDFNTTLTGHPSKTMNDFMLASNPNAHIAITEDNDWISLIVQTDQRLPPPEDLVNRMLTTHDICEADGVVFLAMKTGGETRL